MSKTLRWVAITRAHRAATLGFALALVLWTAPAAYGADTNPWHINIHRANSARINTVNATAYGADGNPWHINIYGVNSARTSTVTATAYGADRNPWHINIHHDTSALAALAPA
jgi:3D (Asp-Asp-Asp) domain-containing protein